MSRTLAFIAVLVTSAASHEDASALGLMSSPAATVSPWGKLSITAANGQEATEIEVVTVSRINSAGARPESTWINEKIERFWIAEKHDRRAGPAVPTQWADSRSCTEMVETLVTLADLDAITPEPPARIVDARMPGVTYVVEGAGVHPAKSDTAAVRLTNNMESAAGAVVNAALAAWAPCWSDTPPKLED